MTTTTSNVTCIEGERRSLLAIKHKITDMFNLLSTWSGAECCEWRGVGCDTRNGHVVKLDLRSSMSWDDGNWLGGVWYLGAPIVDDLRWVSSLSSLSSRWIPPFQLQIFSASSCNIGPSFPNWLRTQKHLLGLELSNSSIKGTLPEWFESILSDILYLDLSNNQIGGKMPLLHFDTRNQIFFKTSLKMNSNKFEGTIAAFPSNVQLLDFSDNLLSGELPQTDGSTNLNLNVVNLSKNRFTGNIPIDLCRVRGIEVLNLSQNKLSGRIPECLGNMSSLESMDLSNNTITGLVPSSLGSLTGLVTLHLHNNILEGNLPLSLQHLTRLITMDIGYNFLVGDIPFWIGERLINLAILNLQSNKFTGKIPLHFCQLNSLMHLNLAQNNIIGTIPPCFANLSGMITDQGNTVYDTYYYEENILASMKGIQLGTTDSAGHHYQGVAKETIRHMNMLVKLKLKMTMKAFGFMLAWAQVSFLDLWDY
ncbi:hypothetical protein E3N88_37759 [Mikania micrantha]|uniref:Leucine-rich repeat-containing N-terminal plant-type domain-containing protein n=1 Tax=Mikania micrantha TaxID=192012 RepID=A0A5N6LUC5_9ASTR|nr:hypothetical protein E3N88_37759 [Mikania micrantha]